MRAIWPTAYLNINPIRVGPIKMNFADNNLKINASIWHNNNIILRQETRECSPGEKLYTYHLKPLAKRKFTPIGAHIGQINKPSDESKVTFLVFNLG